LQLGQFPEVIDSLQPFQVRVRILLKRFQAERTTEFEHGVAALDPGKPASTANVLAAYNARRDVISITDGILDTHFKSGNCISAGSTK
jgi:hypothetical protein